MTNEIMRSEGKRIIWPLCSLGLWAVVL